MRLKDKKVLVTGACGFIGSHLVERLLEEGCGVKAFVFYNSFNSWGWLDTLPKDKLRDIEVIVGDIRDYNRVRAAIKDAEAVFHLAALIGIPFSYCSPDSYVDTNIKGTLNVLQAGRDLGTKRIIVTSTSEVYGTAKYVAIDEGHPLQGQSPYSATKIAADKIAESFYLSFGVPVAIARPFNTYGPRQSTRAIIPTVIFQVLSSQKDIKLGNVSPTRDFTYVDDTCEGFIEIAKSDKSVGRAINICSGKEASIKDIAALILKIMNSNKKIREDKGRIRPEDSEVRRLLGDNTLIRSLTAWKPKYALEEGLGRTIAWFKENGDQSAHKSRSYTI
jgi:NAD dependent epimerase/dehydratase